MKIEVSEYYKQKGVIAVYVNITKEPRRVATMRYNNGELHSISYAKYLYTSFHKCEVDIEHEVDHINGNKLDDRVENLQVISKRQNNSKKTHKKVFVELTCPVCGDKFIFDKSNLKSHPNPCCSRRCGGIKSHWKNKKEQVQVLQEPQMHQPA